MILNVLCVERSLLSVFSYCFTSFSLQTKAYKWLNCNIHLWDQDILSVFSYCFSFLPHFTQVLGYRKGRLSVFSYCFKSPIPIDLDFIVERWWLSVFSYCFINPTDANIMLMTYNDYGFQSFLIASQREKRKEKGINVLIVIFQSFLIASSHQIMIFLFKFFGRFPEVL